MWVTVNDCIGLPSFPIAPKNIRTKLDKLSNGNKRKKDGTKAWEYLLSCHPLDIQTIISKKQLSEIIQKETSEKNGSVRVKNNTTLDVIRQCPTILENKTAELS